MGEPKPKEDPGEGFLQNYTCPEEDRHLFTSVPWGGGYRWFRSPNILPLEQYRRRRAYDDGGQ